MSAFFICRGETPIPEHKDIVDPNIHDTKGLVAASNGQVHAKVGGVGSWVNPSTLVSVRRVTVLEGFHATTQLIAANDLAQNVLFGGAQAGTDVSIDAAGLMTINTTGYYAFKFNLNFGRTSAVGVSTMFARLVINGVPAGFVQGVRLPDEDTATPFQADFDTLLSAGSTVKVEMYRDSSGASNGGLIAGTTTALASWADQPSAWVRVTRHIGVTN